ncbi:MAG: thiamine ABC transporter substrate-binding protein [Acidimicrobiia bacterium]|nr:thiamine ABC transporter substrate-binding protein [Acidimicrobiia bacterium]MDX2468583.1 thiamine ABC transporter substrate-binding protein [Acidimicrobiia bacterium]
MLTKRLSIALLAAATLIAGCSDSGEATAEPTELVLLTHDSFALSDGILDGFTEESGIAVTVLQSGDAGTMLSQAIITKDNPIADVAYGVDNTFLSRALEEDIFIAYESPLLTDVPSNLQVDSRVTPIDFGDVCINYDKAAFTTTAPPQTLTDLTDPRYRDMLVVEDPASSSPGLAFLLATIATFGEEGDYNWRNYWQDLKDNGVLVASGWTEAYIGAFSGSGTGGTRPIVVSYASSPAVGVYFTDPPPAEAPTAAVLDGCFRQVEYAGILTGTDAPEAAGKLIDYLLSIPVQEDIPLNMFVYPANSAATLPKVFTDYSPVPVATSEVAVQTIELNRETWIDEWTDILR